MEHTGFPSDETLAAFIDGRLDPETRGKVIAHMATCSECYSVFMSATEMAAVVASPNGSRRSSKREWIAVAGMTLAAAIAIVFLFTPIRNLVLPHQDNGMEALAKAAPDQRTIAGRISGFRYQPMVHLVRSAPADPMKDLANGNLKTTAAAVLRAADARPSPANLHAAGVAYLLLGHNDEAIKNLHAALLTETGERSVTAAIDDSNDVALLNDLSAALSDRNSLRRNLDDVAESLRCADKAWRIGGTQEAAWNRAIATEILHGPGSAKTAWQDYLAMDRTSPWATEARKKLAPAK